MPDRIAVPLYMLTPNQEADFFALLAQKEHRKTKDGKPYLKIAVQDQKRELKFPVWSGTAIYQEIKNIEPGTYCKVRGIYRVSLQYGPQLEILKIRPAEDADAADGFDPLLLRPHSPLSVDAMWDELQTFIKEHLGKGKLLNTLTKILKENRELFSAGAASRHHHHNYTGGLLEHTLSVTKIAASLVDHYHRLYPDKKQDISRPLTIAGAVLHDIGKVREYEPEPAGSLHHSAAGELLGHAVLGRDILREAAAEFELEAETQTHLEHIIIAHQRFPDWGAAKPPMSLEAMIVHHADSCDALLGCFWNTFTTDQTDNALTERKNVIGYPLLKPR
ncbi:MAG: HD domain-containing protein [Planctomycetaceae bacterium]|jgi:3'-5' exoribonuclease|nr:HD domain-containing protein [Planctomycetaceae bacterium]